MALRRARSAAGRLVRTAGLPRAAQRAEDQPGQSQVPTPGPLADGLFVNPIAEGADPCVVRDGDRYLWCQSEGNVGVAIWVSDRLTSLGTKHVVWRADAEGPCSQQVWAPELFRFDDRWYVYFAASDGDNSNHLTYVLASSTDDVLGPYTLHGPLLTGDNTEAGGVNVWAIDLTVLEHRQQRYAVWSGWPAPGEDSQHLYIAPMASPVALAGPRVLLCANDDHVWERIDERARSRGLNEAPQVLARGGRTFVIYSCASSWLPTYKEGMLELTGGDPLDAASWHKHERPIFESTAATYGVGHSGFVTSVDGSQWWHVFHAKRDRQPDWRRALFAQPFSWDDDGLPQLGRPVAAGSPLAVPAGTPQGLVSHRRSWRLDDTASVGDFDYYGHHQFIDAADDGLHLGRVPAAPVNDYRSGEKVVLRGGAYTDVEVSAVFEFVAGNRAAGLVFRTTGAAVGHDAQRGYFAGIALDRQALVVGKTDGHGWTPLSEAPLDIATGAKHRVDVRAVGDHIEVESGSARVDVHDDDFPRGSVGLRVVDTHAVFTDLAITPLPSI